MISLLLVVSVLFLISIIHFYWAFGGRWGAEVALPLKKGSQEPVFVPRKIGTLLVAFLLVVAAFLLFIKGVYLHNVQEFNFFLLVVQFVQLYS